MKEDIDLFVKLDSPLTTFPPPKSGSLYADLVLASIIHCRDLIKLLLITMIPHDKSLGKKDVLVLSQAFAQVASNVNPKRASAMKKIRMISMKSLNLNGEGLDLLARLGLTQSESSWHRERSKLARMDEMLHKERSKDSAVFMLYDNMNTQFNKMRNDQTLLVSGYDKVDSSHLPDDDMKSFKEQVLSINAEMMLLSSPTNFQKKVHLEKVVMTSLVAVVSEMEGCFWMREFFPKIYHHEFYQYSAMKSKVRILVPLNKNENSNTEHEEILDFMNDWFIDTVEAKQLDKKQFKKDFTLMRDYDGEDEEELQEVQERMRRRVQKAGELLNWGDQLTCERQRTACEIRAGDDTDFETLQYVRNLNFAGLMHATMNMTILNYNATIEDVDMTEDVGSLSEIRGIMKKRMISNQEDKIKETFEKHKKFFVEIGHEFEKDAFKTYIKEHNEMINVEKTEEGAKLLMRGFMETMGIRWMWDPEEEDLVFKDKAHEEAADIINRTLIMDTLELIVHNGDSEGLHAMWRLLAVFYLNSRDEQTSKYAREMLLNIVTYEGLSTRSKFRHDTNWYVNMSGKRGTCVPVDMFVEWCVRYVKSGYRGLGAQLDYIQVSKMVHSMNLMMELMSSDLEAMGEKGGLGGGSSADFLAESEVDKVSRHLKACNLFSMYRKEVSYVGEYRMTWQSATLAGFLKFLSRNQLKFATETPH